MADIQKVALVDRGKVISGGSGGGNTTIRYNEDTDWIQVLYNGVWTNACYAGAQLDPSKMELTQDEFISICSKGLQKNMSIGAIIHLNNMYCNTYEVIDVEHEDVLDSVDIMAHTQVGTSKFNGSSSPYNHYNTSPIRTWINGSYIEAFDSSIQALMKTMQVKTNDIVTIDKAKILSWRELGLNQIVMSDTDGGEHYAQVFRSGNYYDAIPDRWRPAGNYGHNTYLWSRSIRTNVNNSVWCVQNTGEYAEFTASNSYVFGILPVMRF